MISDTRALAGDLALAVVRLTRHLRGQRSHSRVTLTQLSAMQTLRTEGAMTPGVLASRERVQPPSMTRVIASLNELGLVDRTPHPTDGRQIIVKLSSAGDSLLADEHQAREVWLTERLTKLDDDSIAILRDAVGILTELVSEED
ncbi:MarR family winged helix-turn-helix transcriptional regulator [Rhodococcus sp. SJ-2]